MKKPKPRPQLKARGFDGSTAARHPANASRTSSCAHSRQIRAPFGRSVGVPGPGRPTISSAGRSGPKDSYAASSGARPLSGERSPAKNK